MAIAAYFEAVGDVGGVWVEQGIDLGEDDCGAYRSITLNPLNIDLYRIMQVCESATVRLMSVGDSRRNDGPTQGRSREIVLKCSTCEAGHGGLARVYLEGPCPWNECFAGGQGVAAKRELGVPKLLPKDCGDALIEVRVALQGW